MRLLSIGLALAGLSLVVALVAWFGFGHVVGALLAVGWRGFGVYTGWQLGLFVLLGFAWFVLVRKGALRRAWVFIWGRMVRDASGHLLPFSTIGGFVLGARAITLHGVGWAAATATTVVDVTAEFVAELAFALIGFVLLLIRAPDSGLIGPIAGVVVVAIAGSALLFWLQRGGSGIFRAIGRRIAGTRFQGASERLAQMGRELDRIYSNPFRLALGASLHLLGWIGTAFETWIAYRLLGVPVDFVTALVIEALLRAVLTVAFVVPAAVGVQEAAYTGFGAMLGLPAEVSLGVSLLRRARDIVLGVPILMVWQGMEAKRLAEEA